MLPTLFLVSILLVAVFYLYSTWTYDYWKKRGVPFVKPRPLFGNYLETVLFKKTLADLILDIYRHGVGLHFVGCFLFRMPVLLVRDPKIIEQVLVTKFDSFCNTWFPVDESLDPLFARNPINLGGPAWRAVRTLLSTAFTPDKVKLQFPLMALHCREMIQYLEREASTNRPGGLHVRDLTKKFTTDVVMRCGFGVLGNSFSEPEAVLRKLGEDLTTSGIWKSIRYLIFMTVPKMPKLLRPRFLNLDGQNLFRQLITELIKYRENNRVFRNDYLQMLMHLKQVSSVIKGVNTIRITGVNIEYTDEDIASHAFTFFFSGYELPSYVLTFALYELATNPEIQSKLRAEIDYVLMKHSGGLTYEAVQEMFYLDMVLKETIRKYPPLMVIFRKCTRSCVMSLPEGGSFLLEKGTIVFIPAEGLHMNPEFFHNPDMFDPERFSEERKCKIKPYTFLPYGGGPRQCLAMKFGEAVMKAGLVSIVSYFEIKTTPRTPMKLEKDPFSFMQDVKGGIWLDFVRRL